jgi:nucleotide-binding universal stress UspA family protein
VVVNDTMRLAESSFPAGERTYRRHLTVGVDGSEACGPAVAFAFDRASRLGLALTAVACWWWQDTGPYLAGAMDWSDTARDSEARLVSEQLAGWCDKYPDVKVESTLVRGHPVETLIEESAGSELLVVGSRGHGGFAGLVLGSVSLRVLTHARTPVAVVPSELSSDE